MKKIKPLIESQIQLDMGNGTIATNGADVILAEKINQLIELSSKLIDKVEKLESNQNEIISKLETKCMPEGDPIAELLERTIVCDRDNICL